MYRGGFYIYADTQSPLPHPLRFSHTDKNNKDCKSLYILGGHWLEFSNYDMYFNPKDYSYLSKQCRP